MKATPRLARKSGRGLFQQQKSFYMGRTKEMLIEQMDITREKDANRKQAELDIAYGYEMQIMAECLFPEFTLQDGTVIQSTNNYTND
jgi:hypothetical protein